MEQIIKNIEPWKAHAFTLEQGKEIKLGERVVVLKNTTTSNRLKIGEVFRVQNNESYAIYGDNSGYDYYKLAPFFIPGQWYVYKNEFTKSKYCFKVKNINSKSLVCESINSCKKYTENDDMHPNSPIAHHATLLEDLSEIQQYLPDSHPDKVEQKDEVLVFGVYKVGQIVVSLTEVYESRKEGDLYQVLSPSSKPELYYRTGSASLSPKDWRAATPEEVEAYNQGIRNINEIPKVKVESSIEDLLEEAKRKYPIGTKLKECLGGWIQNDETGMISGIPYIQEDKNIWVKGSYYELCIYREGKWAEIDTKVEEDPILAECARRYPIGSVVESLLGNMIFIVTKNLFNKHRPIKDTRSINAYYYDDGSYLIYKNGEWAKVISYPDENKAAHETPNTTTLKEEPTLLLRNKKRVSLPCDVKNIESVKLTIK